MPKKPMSPEMVAVMSRLRDEIESRGYSVNQIAEEMGIRAASFTDGALSRQWIPLAQRIGFSLDWVMLGKRDFQRENQRLTEVVADLSARLGIAPPVGQALPSPEPRRPLGQAVDRLKMPGLRESRQSGKRKKPPKGTE